MSTGLGSSGWMLIMLLMKVDATGFATAPFVQCYISKASWSWSLDTGQVING
jgi:hypothetical protein